MLWVLLLSLLVVIVTAEARRVCPSGAKARWQRRKCLFGEWRVIEKELVEERACVLARRVWFLSRVRKSLLWLFVCMQKVGVASKQHGKVG